MARSLTRRPPRGLRLTIAAAMALVAVAALVFARLRPRTDAERLATMGDDVREAVLRDFAPQDLKGELVFLSFEGDRDATDAFLARVADLPCRVRKGSDALATADPRTPVDIETSPDRATGNRGVLATIEIRRWINDNEVEVQVVLKSAEFYYVPISNYFYRMSHGNHSWHIAKKLQAPGA